MNLMTKKIKKNTKIIKYTKFNDGIFKLNNKEMTEE